MMFWLIPFVMMVLLGLVAAVLAFKSAGGRKFPPLFCGADRVTCGGFQFLLTPVSARFLRSIRQYVFAPVIGPSLRALPPNLVSSPGGFLSFGSYAISPLVTSAARFAITKKAVCRLSTAFELACRFRPSAPRAFLSLHISSCLRATGRIPGGVYGI